MDIKELKRKAKEFAFSNKWNVWKIVLLVGVTETVISYILGLIPGQKVCETTSLGLQSCTTTAFGTAMSLVSTCILSVLSVVSAGYVLALIRDKKAPEIKDVIEGVKKTLPAILLVALLFTLNVAIGAVLLIVPGIMAALGLTFYAFVMYENPTLKAKEILKKTWDLMNGYKGNYFGFILSFLGWGLLVGVSLGIASIWAVPFVTVANAMYYEELKRIKNIQ